MIISEEEYPKVRDNKPLEFMTLARDLCERWAMLESPFRAFEFPSMSTRAPGYWKFLVDPDKFDFDRETMIMRWDVLMLNSDQILMRPDVQAHARPQLWARQSFLK